MGERFRKVGADMMPQEHARALDRVEALCESWLEDEEVGATAQMSVNLKAKGRKGWLPRGLPVLAQEGPGLVLNLAAQLRRIMDAQSRVPTPADIIAHLAAQPDGGDALLRELLRAAPDRAVRVVDGAKVARKWAAQGPNRVRHPLGRPVTPRGPRDNGEDVAAYIGPVEERGRPGVVRSWMYSTSIGWSSDAADEEDARAKSDASSVAAGWVLAGGGR